MAISAAVMFFSGLRASYFEQAFEIALKTRAIAVNTVIRLVLVIVPSFSLIAKYGAVGAAMAVLISETIGLVVSIVWANRVMPVPIPWDSWAKIIAATGAMVAVLVLIPGKATVLGLVLAIVAGVVIYGGAIILMHVRGLRMYVGTFSPAWYRSTR